MVRIILLVSILFLSSLLTLFSISGCQSQPFPLRLNEEAHASNLTASGFIEAEQVSIASELGGKIKEMKVEEGDKVVVGSTLITLDDNILDKQIDQAQMALEVALSNFALVKAGPRQEEIRQKMALLQQAEALRDGAKKARDNATAILNSPQELEAKIVAANGQLNIAERNAVTTKRAWDNASRDYETTLKQARATLDAAYHQVQQAQIHLDQAERLELALLQPSVTTDWVRPPYGIQNTLQYDLYVYQAQMARQALGAAKANRDAAQARLEGLLAALSPVDIAKGQYEIAVASREMAKAVLDDLLKTRENPLILKSQLDGAEAQYRQAIAATDIATATLDTALAGATNEQLRVAEAQVKLAEASLQLLRTQKEKVTISSPISGIIAQKAIRAGEIALPGVTLVKIINLEKVTLKVFISETQIGQLRLGGIAQVSVDSYPERTFQGRITYISPQAEFTPKNIQTKEERAKTVFAVKINLDNPEGILKPGMPADASIELI